MWPDFKSDRADDRFRRWATPLSRICNPTVLSISICNA